MRVRAHLILLIQKELLRAVHISLSFQLPRALDPLIAARLRTGATSRLMDLFPAGGTATTPAAGQVPPTTSSGSSGGDTTSTSTAGAGGANSKG